MTTMRMIARVGVPRVGGGDPQGNSLISRLGKYYPRMRELSIILKFVFPLIYRSTLRYLNLYLLKRL